MDRSELSKVKIGEEQRLAITPGSHTFQLRYPQTAGQKINYSVPTNCVQLNLPEYGGIEVTLKSGVRLPVYLGCIAIVPLCFVMSKISSDDVYLFIAMFIYVCAFGIYILYRGLY